MKKIFRSLCLIVTTILASSVMAQSITITSPSTDAVHIEGDDFFGTVLKDPLDFDKRRDFLWEENWIDPSLSVSDGVYSGTSAGHNYIFPLFHGFKDTVNIGKYGANFPIDTKKYTGFSVVSSISDGSKRNFKNIRWSRTVDFPDLGPTALLRKHWLDQYTTNTNTLKYASDQMIFDIIDLSGDSNWTDAPIRSLLYDQAGGDTNGVSESISSIRVYDPNSSGQYEVKWNYAGLVDLGPGIPPKVNIYLDNDNIGHDGILMKRLGVSDGGSGDRVSGSGSYSFPLAALAPGEYYIHLKVFEASGAIDKELASSGYTGKITINAKPQIKFNNPSFTSGEDYATSVRQNPWDFNDSSDVVNLDLPEHSKQIKNEVFTNGYLEATAYIPDANRPGQHESDSQVWLNTGSINPNKFRYLTYEMEVDPQGYTTIEDKVRRGWIVRSIWWQTNPAVDGGVTSDIVTYEGRNSYSVDLTDIVMATDNGPVRKWNTLDFIDGFRLDPLETDPDTKFKLYDVKLTANPEPNYQTNEFTVHFEISDKEGETSSVKFYVDSDDSGFDGSEVASGSFAPGTHSLSFSTASLAKSDYYLYSVITDSAGNKTSTYADVPITVAEEVNQGVRTPRYRVYNPNDGHHHYTTDLNEYNVLETLGWVKEGISAYIYDDEATLHGSTTKPYYRLFNPYTHEHHWTVDLNEYNVLGGLGWNQEGVDGHIFTESIPGSSPLYRLYKPSSGFHHWTKDTNERNVLIANHGWVDEGIAGYVYSSLE